MWDDVGAASDTIYEKYYFHYIKTTPVDPIDPVVVRIELFDFFGTRPLNLLIIGKPYGWLDSGSGYEFNWPPTGLNDAKEHHKITFKKYREYKTRVWMDFNIVALVEAETPDTNFREMMEASEAQIITLCDELKDFGFTYMGRITTAVDASYFAQYIEPFYPVRL